MQNGCIVDASPAFARFAESGAADIVAEYAFLGSRKPRRVWQSISVKMSGCVHESPSNASAKCAIGMSSS